MRISLVLCTYNGARFLPAQLDSLLTQTRLPDEIIICDDASSDNSMALLDAFAARMRTHSVHVHLHQHPENQGFVHNFSGALCRTSGDIVFLCDQDDVWHADKIARMAAEFAQRPDLELLHTDARLIDAQGHVLDYTLFDALELSAAEREAEHAGQAFDVLLNRNTVTGATAAFRQRLIARALPVPDGWIHDEWLAICASLDGSVDLLEWPSIDYRQHENNQIGIRLYSPWERLTRRKLSKREHMQRIASRLQSLLQHQQEAAISSPLTAQRMDNIRARAAHAHFRGHLPASLWPRIRGVWAETWNGHYWRYSGGIRSIISDLIDWG